MVAIRRYGPYLGAGTAIIEQLAERAITPSPYGIVAWAGIFEKGETDKLITVNTKSELQRKTGGRIPESYLPICAQDFWDSSFGAGRMLLVRITDGTGRKAKLTALSREYSGTIPGPGHWRNVCDVEAKSVGRWGGAEVRRIGEITGAGDLTETTIDTGLTLKEDEFAGGVLTLTEIAGQTFEIIGNTTDGVVTVRPDAQLLTKFGTGTNNEYVLYKDDTGTFGNTKKVSVLWKNGARDPLNEFGLEVYQNDQKILEYPDLSQDDGSDVYYIEVINNDSQNEEIVLTDLFAGTVAPVTRPANHAGEIPATGLTTIVMPLQWYQEAYDSGNSGNGTVAVTVKASTQQDYITLECTDATIVGSEVWSVSSTAQDRAFADATTAVAYTGPNDYFVDFTITAGVNNWAVGDKIYINVNTIRPAEVIGGSVYYNTEDTPLDNLEIVAATVSTVSVRPGNDLTTLTTAGKPYRLQYKQGLFGGYDGHSGVGDNDYIQAFDPSSSLFNQHKDKQLGLIKFAVPGVSSVAVQKAARAYAESINSPFRQELPSGISTENAAVTWVEETMGRNDFAQVILPSWYYITDPDRDRSTILIPVTGAVQGVEALTAYTRDGYHKAAAGVSAILAKCVKIPSGERVLNDEITNPKGIQVVLKKEGNWVIWGDRVPASSSGLVFKHQRELLSHYERIMFENMGPFIFEINDEAVQDRLKAVLNAYFFPEWRPKSAIRGETFEKAILIKVDNEINTNFTRAAGDLFASVKPRLADTVERVNIIMSSAGIFEELG